MNQINNKYTLNASNHQFQLEAVELWNTEYDRMAGNGEQLSLGLDGGNQ